MNQEEEPDHQDHSDSLPPHEQPQQDAPDDARLWRIDALSRLARYAVPAPEVEAGSLTAQQSAVGQMAQPMLPTTSRTWTQRLVLPAVLVLAVLALLTLPPGFPLHPLVSGFAHQVFSAAPTATPALPISARQLYPDADVPGTVVTLDSHRISLPVIGREAPLVLTPGVHHLTWGSAPFHSQSCQLSIPASGSDTCNLLASTASFSGELPVPVVELGESLDTLPATQQTALLQATQTTLTTLPSTTVHPGETFFGSAGPTLASTTFQASLTFQLQSEAGIGCSLGVFNPGGGGGSCQLTAQQGCARFCSLPWPSQQVVHGALGTAGWLVLAVVSLSWTYRSLDGSLIASNQPLDFGMVAASDNHLVMLSISWDSAGWHVTPVLGEQLGGLLLAADGTPVADDPACAQAQGLLYQLRFEVPGGAPGGTIHIRASANPSDGCLVTVGPAVYLVRLGIVIPANQPARALGSFQPPPVPNLTANDAQLVTQLQALPGQDVGTSLGA